MKIILHLLKQKNKNAKKGTNHGGRISACYFYVALSFHNDFLMFHSFNTISRKIVKPGKQTNIQNNTHARVKLVYPAIKLFRIRLRGFGI